MRTEIEALKEIRDRIIYFCSRTDGKYDPPWAQEVIGIIDDALGTDGFTNSDYEEAKATGRHFVIQPLGDAAKLREALVEARKVIKAMYWAKETLPIIDAALDAPPRNCDKQYKDRVEMYDAFKYWCNARGHTMNPKLAYDAFEWLLGNYEEGCNDGDK